MTTSGGVVGADDCLGTINALRPAIADRRALDARVLDGGAFADGRVERGGRGARRLELLLVAMPRLARSSRWPATALPACAMSRARFASACLSAASRPRSSEKQLALFTSSPSVNATLVNSPVICARTDTVCDGRPCR
jgi:hypothetical protein